MLKFSIPEFADNFEKNVAELIKEKKNLRQIFLLLKKQGLMRKPIINLLVLKISGKNYKNVVTDAIVSASVTKNFEFAAIIATTSGEEVGSALVNEFDSIIGGLDSQSCCYK